MTIAGRGGAVLVLGLVGAWGFPGCADGPDPQRGATSPAGDAAAADATTDGASATATRCRPGAGASGAPASIDDAVRLVNSLPRPVTVTCFVESLDRPLHITASQSVISLQPADGRRSPRIFLMTDQLVMSIVVDGKGRNLVDFGQFVTTTRTLKGELAFPAQADVPAAEPYQRIHSLNPSTGEMGTSCRFCHPDEQPAMQAGGAVGYISGAFRPDFRTQVPLDDVRHERAICNPAAEPDRCDFLRALLDHGDVVESAFPAGVPTIFQ
jgi:hypothetical protein